MTRLLLRPPIQLAIAGLMLCGLAAAADAATIDLTTAGATGTDGTAIFQQTAPQPTGTGVIDSFVRIEATGNADTEQGYNTDFRPVQFDEKTDIHTRSLLLSDVPIVNVGGVDYRQFLLDINEPQGQNQSTLSMDDLELFLGNAGDLHNFPTFDGNATKIYSLGDNVVLLDAAINPGSGIGDMFALIPDSLFTGPNQFVYLYSHFGTTAAAGGGFEEWSVIGPSAPIPLPPAAYTALITLGGLALVGARKSFKI